jgi:early secretory antigenic target protein ESAT-6
MADPNSIFVSYGKTEDISTQLVAADHSIQSLLDELNRTIVPLRATWSGASDEEYTHVQARWNQDMTEMQNMLPVYSNTLNDMSGNYANTDNRVASQWAGIH